MANRTSAASLLERLKSISGNDIISVNRKFRGVVTAKLATKIVMICNQHPKLLDDSTALAAREIAIIFRKSFLGREDRDLRAKLDSELLGIAIWALLGLQRLRANGRFTIGAQGKAAVHDLALQQSPALRFAEDRLIVTGDPADHVRLNEVFGQYLYWAKKH